MISRRTALTGALAGSAILLGREAFATPPERILFGHGRAQGGRAPDEMRAEWMAAFRAGLSKAGMKNPEGIDIQLPFYGDALDEITAQFGLPLASNINTRGDALQDEFLIFQEEVANEMRQGAGITDAQIDAEYGDNPREKGPLNWEWVQAIVRAIDRNAAGLSQGAIEVFLRDVFLYVSRPGVQRAIDGIVNAGLDDRPTVVVGHSLGSVVAFNILSQRSDTRVPLFVTLGSPLGIRAIRRRFTPLKYPQGVGAWFNAFDPRDIVALYPLDSANFDVLPAVENAADIDNQTDNRHGISGYLDKARIASRVVNGVQEWGAPDSSWSRNSDLATTLELTTLVLACCGRHSCLLGRGYDAEWFREALRDKGIRPCIPGRTSRGHAVRYDQRRYKRRNRIEIMFGRLKDWRRMATRYARCPKVFLSAIALAAAVIVWL